VTSVARRFGLSHAALNALAVIEGAGGPLPTGEVTARMHISTATMTSILDTLERKGLVRREHDLADRRRVLVDITPESQELLDHLLPAVQQQVTAALGQLGDETLAALLDLLPLAIEALDAAPRDLPPPAGRRTPPGLWRA
jgi:DNA-binding MarR family transcriptional regulator